MHAILESDAKVANVRDSLNDALALLDDVNENLATFDTKLLVMREDIAAIEVGMKFSSSFIPFKTHPVSFQRQVCCLAMKFNISTRSC